MSTDSRADVGLWLLWKRASESIRASVVLDVAAASDASEAELTVLVQLREMGGQARQNALAVATGWDRTRLSHLLTRMEARGYISRERIRNGVEVILGEFGAATLAAAEPFLGRAVHDHLTSKLDAEQRATLQAVLAVFAD